MDKILFAVPNKLTSIALDQDAAALHSFSTIFTTFLTH